VLRDDGRQAVVALIEGRRAAFVGGA